MHTFAAALKELVDGADTLSMAVAYLKVGGWLSLRKCINGLNFDRMRLVCTDQMAVTQPAAIRRAIADRVQVRNFSGTVTYHPKVYIAHRSDGTAMRYLLGSANLSAAALSHSVEAGLLGEDRADLKVLHEWFNDLFENRSSEVTSKALLAMEEYWRAAAGVRAATRLLARRSLPAKRPLAAIEAEDVEVIEDVFATISPEIGLLNMDYARNNIRRVARIREALAKWAHISVSTTALAAKQRSELSLLGFVRGHELTELGRRAQGAGSDAAFAEAWCRWIQETPDVDLERINTRLKVAKRVFRRFWKMRPEVRSHFLAHAEGPRDATLQTIELLCNAGDLAEHLSLDDVRTLVPLLERRSGLPVHVREAVDEYFGNKGRRSWKYADRRVVPEAWRTAEEAKGIM